MPTKVFTPIRGKRIRVTELDECSAILATSRKIVTDGFVSVTLTPNIEDASEITVTRADGSLCVSERGNPNFKNFGVEVEFCSVNPALLAIVTNAEEYQSAANSIGFTVPEGAITGRFGLELWTGLAGAGCGADGGESGYLLLPAIASGTLGDITVDGENAITFTVTNAATVGGNGWGTGPYNVVMNSATPPIAAKLPTALDPLDHLLMLFTGVAVPEVNEQPTLVTA